jgi:TonB family protein
LNDSLKDLISRSLAPRDGRVTDAGAWHQNLAKIMADGSYNPTTFNLAFFMHNLFRDEIEQEGEEIAAEKTLEIPVAAPAPETPPAAGPTPDFREDTKAVREEYGIEADEKKSKSGLLIGAIAAAALVVIAVAVYFLVLRGKPVEEPQEVAQAEAPAQQPVEPVQQEPQGPSPEEIQSQIEGLVQDQMAGMAEELKAEYEQQLAQLQAQLKDAQDRAQRDAEAAAAARAAQDQQAPAEEPAAEVPAKTATPDPTAAEPSGGDALAEEQKTEDAVTEVGQAPGTEAVAQEREGQVAAAEPEEAKPEPVQEATKVQYGSLVQAGPGVTGPRLKRIPPARFPRIAQRMNRREATVHVLVLVDENGKVIDQKLKGDKVGFGFDEEALNVSSRATFEPATKEGVKVKMWVSLPIRFQG